MPADHRDRARSSGGRRTGPACPPRCPRCRRPGSPGRTPCSRRRSPTARAPWPARNPTAASRSRAALARGRTRPAPSPSSGTHQSRSPDAREHQHRRRSGEADRDPGQHHRDRRHSSTKNAGTAVSAESARTPPGRPRPRRALARRGATSDQADRADRRPDQGDGHRRVLAVGQEWCRQVAQGQHSQDDEPAPKRCGHEDLQGPLEPADLTGRLEGAARGAPAHMGRPSELGRETARPDRELSRDAGRLAAQTDVMTSRPAPSRARSARRAAWLAVALGALTALAVLTAAWSQRLASAGPGPTPSTRSCSPTR